MQHPTFSRKNNIARSLRTVRKARHLSQESFDQISSRTYVSTLERGLKSPTLKKVDELAEAMQIHPLTLLTLAYCDQADEHNVQTLLETVKEELLGLIVIDNS